MTPKNAAEAAVIRLLDTALNQRNYIEASDKYVGPYYRQPNPTMPDGDFMIVHSLVTTGPADRDMAVVDIFRVENGKIVEHWDVAQPVLEKALNTNTMF